MSTFIREMIFKIKFYFWEKKVIKQIEKHYERTNKREEDIHRNETI